MPLTARVPSEATSDMTRINANFRMKKKTLPETNYGHFSSASPIFFIRVDSWAIGTA